MREDGDVDARAHDCTPAREDVRRGQERVAERGVRALELELERLLLDLLRVGRLEGPTSELGDVAALLPRDLPADSRRLVPHRRIVALGRIVRLDQRSESLGLPEQRTAVFPVVLLGSLLQALEQALGIRPRAIHDAHRRSSYSGLSGPGVCQHRRAI